MSLNQMYALGYLKERLPSTADVSMVGATIFVRGDLSDGLIESIDGQQLKDNRKLNHVEGISDDKETFEIISA